MIKQADSVSDFKVIDDSGHRRVSVFGMGWTGYTLGKLSINDLFDGISDADDGITVDSDELRFAAYQAVSDDELSALAYYFYNLGMEHGKEKME